MTSLGFQALWFRGFSLIIGSTSQAISLIIGFFLLGISLGSFATAAMSPIFHHGKKHPLLYYGLAEFLGGLIAVMGIYTLFHNDNIIIDLLLTFQDKRISTTLIVAIFVLPSTFFLGAGLPFLASEKRSLFRLERLYATNTLGGAFGCFIFGILTPYYFSFFISALVAFIINFLILTYSLVIEMHLIHNKYEEKRRSFKLNRKALFLSVLSGFFFISLEIVSERMLGLILGDRSYIGILTLILILIIIALGAYTVRIIKKTSHLFNIVITTGFLSLFIIYIFKDQAFLLTIDQQNISLSKILYIVFGLSPLLFSLSLVLPTCLTWIKQEDATTETGTYLAANTLSALFASLLTTHFLFPTIGLNGTMMSVTAGIMVIGFLTLRSANKFLLLGGIPILILFYSSPFSITKEENIILQKETPLTHFTVVKRNGMEEIYGGNNRLIAPWKRKNIAFAQEALAFFPALYKKDIRQTLTIGLGYGITARAFLELSHGDVEIVEILPSLINITDRYKELNGSWNKDPRAKVFNTDGISHLSLSPKKYDIISVSIDNAYTSGGSFALTKEFYSLVSKKLTDGGIFSQMIWGPHLPEIVATLKSVFPYLKLIPADSDTDYIIIASKEPIKSAKEIVHYNDKWSTFLHDGKRRTISQNLDIGERVLNKILIQKHRFIISKHSPKLELEQNKNLGYFWVRK